MSPDSSEYVEKSDMIKEVIQDIYGDHLSWDDQLTRGKL